ncbi:MAG: adenine deaminase [Candidatus Izemoplasmatales bacterium]|nr:adenine deaminase [Candidatus Izemoplasmatales bacterium]
MDKRKLLKVAKGEALADLIIKNAKVINVFSKTVDEGNIAICDGVIVGIGDYSGRKEVDALGYYIAPGFIDGHVHIESSMLIPSNYAKAVMTRGTTSVIADCHEIANVCGKNGIDFMLASSAKSPLDVFMMIPSCVPSTEYETSGARLLAKDIKDYLKHDKVIGLGEMMDYPGAINGKEDVLEKIEDFSQGVIDGHAPGVEGKNLNAYVLAGIKTDHECTTPQELLEKIKRGMYVHLREGSQTKNVSDLLPSLNKSFYHKILFCSDDLHPSDIRKIGHIDNNINIAIKNGIEPIEAISMATINIAECYGLSDLGAIAPGKKADLVWFKDINNIKVDKVYKNGNLVFEDEKTLFNTEDKIDKNVLNTVRVKYQKSDLIYHLNSEYANVIGLIKNNVTTTKIVEKIVLQNGEFNPKNNPGLLKLIVIERHKKSGNIGKAIVKDYGLKNSALALTIAHDSHNLICVGDNDDDIDLAVRKIIEIGGGIVFVQDKKIVDYLPLEVAGLMSLCEASVVETKLLSIESKLREAGVNAEIEDPILQLAFLSLPVIPDLKITDKGLFDTKEFKIISLEASEKP